MRGDRVGGPIRWRMHLPVARARAFEALDSSAGRRCFWAEEADEADGVIEFRFVNGYVHRAPILERVPDRRFSVEYLGGIATFELTEDGSGGTDLLLDHQGVAPENWQEVHAGWLNVLFPLKGWLVHGVDLRNHDPERSWDQGYADQ